MIQNLVSDIFNDVRFIFMDGSYITAHRVVLSAASKIFKDILVGVSMEDVIHILVPDISYIHMKHVIEFFYTGEVSVDRSDLHIFKENCAYFGVKVFQEDLDFTENITEIINKDSDPAKQYFDDKIETLLEIEEMKHESSEEIINLDEKVCKKDLNRIQNIAGIVDKENTAMEDFIDSSETHLKQESSNEMKDLSLKVKINADILEVDPLAISRKNAKTNQCTQCKYQTAWQGDLNKHIRIHHEGVRYTCDICNAKFTKKANLSIHKSSKHEGVTFDCTQCDYSTARQVFLDTHIQSKHEGLRFTCKFCPDSFMYNSTLSRHIKRKHLNILYNCDSCKMQCKSSDALKRHKDSVHLRIRYKCNESINGILCDYLSKGNKMLEMHKKSVHSNEMFKCEDCGDEMDTFGKFRKHRTRKHFKIEHQCDQCEYKDPEYSKLKRHIETKH